MPRILMSLLSAFVAASLSAALSGPAAAAEDTPMPQVPASISLMKQDDSYIFKTEDGLALYTFDRDTEEGKSACNNMCATAWPPVPATADNKPLGDWTIITRDDGSLQWAYKGKPVYTFAQDSEAAITGDGMGGVWHLLHP